MTRREKIIAALELVVSAAWWATTSLATIAGLRSRDRMTILRYETVGVDDAGAFAAQIRKAKAWGTPVSADHVGAPGQGPCVAVTVDDASRRTLATILPILAAEAFPCVIFATVDCVDETPGAAAGADAEDAPISALDLLVHPRRLVTIGVRTLLHPRLSRLSDELARAEILYAKLKLSRLLGYEIDTIALNDGDQDDRIVKLCEDAGYMFVYSTAAGTLHAADPRSLRARVTVSPHDSALVFWLKLWGGEDWRPWAARLAGAARQAWRRAPSISAKVQGVLSRRRAP